ncbi:cupredoxin domain-containing protein [Jeotgalibacillus sp. S-D1]|uniref:cupredoxin domain-containing protein n=1 Tax=Jeotgalibacillus sp. S-D1 TaxID=2552189 RepID=UPI001059F1F1|nr:cupredoxin domain-containing protein [Jeotgalibacillus sp. S-D1]TDL31110.1 cupredoxin domain-containing protein [Jeotgalibacillus sp. S-D1]
MSVKRVIGLVIVFAMVVVVTTLGTSGVLAEAGVVTQPGEAVKSIEVELNDDYFEPKVITIPNGTNTTLILKNKGKIEHTFTVEKLGIDVEIQPGQEKNVNVKPTQSGTFELICRYHFQEGMVGEVIVK